jgi:hypothetical protein
MREWRNLGRYETKTEETDDCITIVTRKIQPSDELRARGTEIVTAFDAWYKLKRRCGYKKAEKEVRKAEREYLRLEEEVGDTPAHSKG